MPAKSLSPSRRAILAGFVGAMAPRSPLAQDSPPLWAAASLSGRIFGASSSWEVIRDPDYARLHVQQSRLLVTDKAVKFDFLRPAEESFDFAEADALLRFARSNGMLFRGHTLIWNDNAPPWLRGKSSAEIERIFDAHIEAVVTRYAGEMHSWDVVNEPFWPDGRDQAGFRRGPWFDAMGESYIARAFERVARIDRTAKLVLNEAFTEQDDRLGREVRLRMLPLIDRLLDRGVRLDAIGLQAHLKPGLAFDIDAFLRFIDDIRKRGLKIYISEFDVDDESFPREITKRDEAVASWASRFLVPVLKNSAVEAIVTWHLSDRYSWYREPQIVRRRQRDFLARPLPFDDRMMAKPMARAMLQALLAAPRR